MAKPEEDLSWEDIQKSLVSASQSSFTQSDLPPLIDVITRRKSEILSHEDKYENFFSCFVALSAHYIADNSSKIPRALVGKVSTACKTLMEFSLDRMLKYKQACSASQRNLMSIVEGLCVGSSQLQRSNVVTFTALIKKAKCPFGNKKKTASEVTESQLINIHEQKHLSKTEFLSQLMSSFQDSSSSRKEYQTPPSERVTELESSKSSFISRNSDNLHALRGTDILLDVCLNLPFLHRYINSYHETVSGLELSLPKDLSDATPIKTSFSSVLNAMTMVSRILALPTLEVMTPVHLEKATTIIISCLYAAIYAATASVISNAANGGQAKGQLSGLKEDDQDNLAALVVHKGIGLFDKLSQQIIKSTRSAGHHLQNLNMLGAWCVLRGLQYMMNLDLTSMKEKSRERESPPPPSQPGLAGNKPQGVPPEEGNLTRILWLKGNEPFNRLVVELSSFALKCFGSVLDDFHLENLGQTKPFTKVSPASPSILKESSAASRILLIIQNISLPSLLLKISNRAYMKTCLIVKTKLEQEKTEAASETNSVNEGSAEYAATTEESSDDDSEPILGPWFEEATSTEPEEKTATIPPPPPPPPTGNKNDENKGNERKDEDEMLEGPEKEETTMYLNLAAEVLQFLSVFLHKYNNLVMEMSERIGKQSLVWSGPHMSNLAEVVADMDRGDIRLGEEDGSVMDKFSSCLLQFCHGLLSCNCLPHKEQSNFLANLKVDPNSEGHWPLFIPPRTLAVFAHVFMAKLQTDEGLSEVKMVLLKFLDTLSERCIDGPALEEKEVNVEHIQFLMLIFDFLKVEDKSEILRQCALYVLKISQSSLLAETPPLGPCRLLQVFEYLLFYFSKAAPQLYEQVQWNIFTVQSSDPALLIYQNEQGGLAKTKFYTQCSEMEENLEKVHLSGAVTLPEKMDFVNLKRCFYNLVSDCSDKDGLIPLDKQACDVLYDESFDYGEFYQAMIELQAAGSNCDNIAKNDNRTLPYTIACAMHYAQLITWRILGYLAPSVAYLKLLEGQHQGKERVLSTREVIHTMRWVPRLTSEKYKPWIMEHLCEQRLPATEISSLLDIIGMACDNVSFDVQLTRNAVLTQLGKFAPLSHSYDCFLSHELPGFSSVCMLNLAMAKLQVTLYKLKGQKNDGQSTTDYQDLMLVLLRLLQMLVCVSRSCLMFEIVENSSLFTAMSWSAHSAVYSIISSHAQKHGKGTSALRATLSEAEQQSLNKWNTSFSSQTAEALLAEMETTPIMSECYLDKIMGFHLNTLTKTAPSPVMVSSSLKYLMFYAVQLVSSLKEFCPKDVDNKETINETILPILLDASSEYIFKTASSIVAETAEALDSNEIVTQVYLRLYGAADTCIRRYGEPGSRLSEKAFLGCLSIFNTGVEEENGRKALRIFYEKNADICFLLMAASKPFLSQHLTPKLLQYFLRITQIVEAHPSDTDLPVVLRIFGRQMLENQNRVENWLKCLVKERTHLQENKHALESLASALVKEHSIHITDAFSTALLRALIPIASQLLTRDVTYTMTFADLMPVMVILARYGYGDGHMELFQAAYGWLEECQELLSQKDVIEKMKQANPDGMEKIFFQQNEVTVDAACCILSYIADILSTLKQSSERVAMTAYDMETTSMDVDSDWADEMGVDDEDSGGEDSDEDSLCNKLCTFTLTQKVFMNQHWYHCHTCKMVDGVGVCTICAKVCHKGHELSYAKYGSFFCDCGAKEDGSCMALIKRHPGSNLESSMSTASMPSPFSSGVSTNANANTNDRGSNTSTGSGRPRTQATISLASPTERPQSSQKFEAKGVQLNAEELAKLRRSLRKLLEKHRGALLAELERHNPSGPIIELLGSLMSPIEEHYNQTSAVGTTARAQSALHRLHTEEKTVDFSEQLMVPTLGSQEGAFENVRANFSGDQGQTIRQLLNAHMLHRVAMCCLASPYGRRQHLAVCHEKGRITVLQLSALLKQADSSKKKLTLTRLSSATVPFTVLGITGNPCNEDFLAVCGLKDCHVLTFTGAGTVSDQLVLHCQLEAGNFIIKALWLPGSQTELAIVTADFVKIYNLAKDAISPKFYFLVPSGKIRDVCFIFTEESRHLVLMSSAGYMYTQRMEAASEAKHGPFYVTNVLEATHADLTDTGGQVAGGGVSCYYSHTLQMLFFSYAHGKTFCAPVNQQQLNISSMYPITLKNNGGKSGNPPPLCQWNEVPMHPGLVCALTQANSIPVVLMMEPDKIRVQEIKTLPAKSKVQDMVAIRHSSSSEQQRTTLILLCEDGSLRIYMANVDTTSHWMSSQFQAAGAISALKPIKKKKVVKAGRPTGQVSFPVDFFESCQALSEVEYGGNDLLQVYNIQQIKHRLNTNGMYVASTKAGGFSIDVFNNNASMVMVGLRVHVGTQSIERAPSYLEVFGRTSQVSLTRNRWFDMPFTREEALTADKKFTVFVGQSVDPDSVTMVDSIVVYSKTKETFNWYDEQAEEFASTPTTTPASTSASSGPSADSEPMSPPPVPMTSLDKILSSSLEVLDGVVNLVPHQDDSHRDTILRMGTDILTLPTPQAIQQHVKTLLTTVQPSGSAYHDHKDKALLAHVVQCLNAEPLEDTKAVAVPAPELDPEAFQRLVVTARSVATSRPINLVSFADRDLNSTLLADMDTTMDPQYSGSDVTSDTASSPTLDVDEDEGQHFLTRLLDAFWRLHSAKPSNSMLAPACLPGLTHIEITVGALVEIIYAFASTDLSVVPLATKLIMRLLISEDTNVSFAAKQALIRVMHPHPKDQRVVIPSPPRCSSPSADQGMAGDEDKETSPDVEEGAGGVVTEQEVSESSHDEASYDVIEPESMELEPGEADPEPDPPANGAVGSQLNFESLLGRGRVGGFPPMLDIPPETEDDEAMMELAIALSLQEQSSGSAGSGLNLQSLGLASDVQGVGAVQGQSSSSLETGTLSDTTASAASDDEGSTAATEGSTLRTSPAEHAGSAESESGASGVDSITGEHSMSGRSSAYGDVQEQGTGRTEGGSDRGVVTGAGSGSQEMLVSEDTNTSQMMHSLRRHLLKKLLEYMPELRGVGGVRAIPYMQVILMLSSDLDLEEEDDRKALNHLLQTMLKELEIEKRDFKKISERTPNHEVQLIVMRLLSVFMSRTKSGTKTASEASTQISHATASSLLESGAVDYCLCILRSLLEHWLEVVQEDDTAAPGNNLLKPHPPSSPPDMSPFFLRQYVKGHAGDVFEAYPQLLTEMVLRLPYQIKKICDTSPSVGQPIFDQAWFYYLCEYMMTQQTPFVRRQVRKLLLFISGTKDKYRHLRDLHALESHLKDIKKICEQNGLNLSDTSATPLTLPYDTLIELIEHLKACQEMAASRTLNWQKFCLQDRTVLSSLLQASFYLDEGVASLLLQLLTCALCGNKKTSGSHSSSSSRSKKDKSEDSSEELQKPDEALCQQLIKQVTQLVGHGVLAKFIRHHLLESNDSQLRWQAHGLVLHIFKSSSSSVQELLLDLMWDLWPELSSYGRKAAQYVDLLGYFSLKAPQKTEKSLQYVEKAASLLKTQNQVLTNHPNSTIYNELAGLVAFDGFYLESEPCLVCNNPEIPFTNMKLTALKVDSRYTANSQIVKLVGTHTIFKIALRISDLKRTKMVRTVNIYYNNRTVHSVVDLKNKPTVWHKAKKCSLTAGQTEVKIEFLLPIVAANLMIEYADFYDNLSASAETLQCPRCSASVPANPGVCGNCGENVFQCHKCRAINYDEKDPFLCNSCGFCKYAKFDYTLTAKACCAVDPIENEEDRKKATNTINSLLEKADRVYRQLVSHRPQLEVLLAKVQEPGLERHQDGASSASTTTTTTSSTATVNRAIQMLAQRYSGDCKNTFEELSKIIQKVLACRKELVEYDRRQKEASQKSNMPHSGMTPLTSPLPSPHPSPAPSFTAVSVPACKVTKRNAGRCYGCAAAATEHCVTLLRALATNPDTRDILVRQGLLNELVEYNLRSGYTSYRNEVRQLIFLLTKDNPVATGMLNDLIMTRISAVLSDNVNPDMASSFRYLMMLLMSTCTAERYDSCWEMRLKCIMTLFMKSVKISSPVVMENITLPCLKVMHHVIKPANPTSKKNKEETVGNLSTVKPVGWDVYINTKDWLSQVKGMYDYWKQRVPSNTPGDTAESDNSTQQVRGKYLMEKYARRWMVEAKKSPESLHLGGTTWLRRVLFSPSSRSARQVACNIVESICQVSSRRQQMLDLLTSYLDEIGPSGESAVEFITLYQRLISAAHWKLYLAAKGVLPHVAELITKEIEVLSLLEDTTLTSDLSQGYALKMLTNLLSSFLDVESIRRHYKSKLLGPVLHGYLALRKLIVQRTKLIDETQQMLLDLLEDMTTGTESETGAFMAVCVDTVKRYGLDDLRTPVFIFERLCSIIYPEENEVGEFFMTLEKDPQQEDFLQGRMQGNPYSSNEPDLGPTMREVKNKICRDCELIALLEDDTGMELLVNNKIMSLDLPVKEVYKKIWCPDNEGEPMRIIYRMRGLLGDATEEFIENLNNSTDEEADDEEVYKMAGVMTTCEGLEVILYRLAHLMDLVRGQQLLTLLLKLLGFCVKVKVNRQQLIRPKMQTVNIMMAVLNRVLLAENEHAGSGGGSVIAEQVLTIMEVILLEAINEPTDKDKPQIMLACDKSQLMALLDRASSPFVRSQSNVLQGLMRIIPFLSFGDYEKMQMLVKYFKPYIEFEKFDDSHTQDEQLHLECFCAIAAGIEKHSNGDQLKDLIIAEGIVDLAVLYVINKLPDVDSSLDSQPWKDFLAKPSLPFVLRLLSGLCKGHAKTQQLVGDKCIPAIHRLEQISSEEGIGSLAENLMEALKTNPEVAKKIDEVRAQTKAEKKRRAMAMRQKQLGALGMSTNEKGQVTASRTVFQQMEDLVEESGLTCCICREGYKYQSQKVLGIYTYTKVAVLEPFELKSKKTQGYSTVSHFNIVHYDCHLAAVRHARGRDEWESAVLQNANTKCNGLLPLWGPHVTEPSFASCLARHNVYLPECSGYREPTYHATLHDLKLLLLRYVQEQSFSSDSGGGGRQSNMHLIPYMIHMALYVINTTRCVPREEKNLTSFLKHPPSKWVELSYELDGPHYYALLALHIFSPEKWDEHKVTLLKQLLVSAHARTVSPGGTKSLSDKAVKDYSIYKGALMYFGLIEVLYSVLLKDASKPEESWSQSVANYIRHNDEALIKNADKVLSTYEKDFQPCESFAEFCDVGGLLVKIPDPDMYLAELLKSVS
ncbi:E3 ubiquitin-protein ligase UBR4-like isoform X2 [Apostichopus japonicus]|uniref:E3 ubiquitin-protein ligase UBR4-like isoform X2 n=1 Tax=Stichopus japonicus TaxID=307972 RepID=UPI003AB40506